MDTVALADRRALKPAEVASLLGYRGRSTVYELVKAGHLHPIEGCPSMRFSHAEIEAFVGRTRGERGAA